MSHSPTDQPARERIRTDLATNFLVEAGAGSGKTTSLVDRLLEHVRTGTPVERIAAVTFTRKAAHELRERFQLRLEQAVRESPGQSEERARVDRALRELDRAFLGTIHAFCARLLRERPIELGLDPEFAEVAEEDWGILRDGFWRRWVERALAADDPDLTALRRVGLSADELADGFATVVMYPDVEFPLAAAPRPDHASCRRELETLMLAAQELMPVREPVDGWDRLMLLVRELEFRRRVGDWDDVRDFCAAVERISKSRCEIVQKAWSGGGRSPAAKALAESWVACLEGEIRDLLRCWREHRYPVVMRVLQRAAADFARERHATGQLGFEDLLLLTARLLREHPAVRDDLGGRYAHLLVDEFQDTDPVQAEVCFLLASASSEGNDWRTVVPRPGSLFVVGDPKQSIYRFRRADIQVYEFVKRRMSAFGDVLVLTSNFRSTKPIEELVNAHFRGAFPEQATEHQAPFRPMETVHAALDGDGAFWYEFTTRAVIRKELVLRHDAELVASWIAREIAYGRRAAGDFLVLTATKAPIAHYARALSERNVAVSTTGAPLPQEHELQELLVVLRALADPEDPVLVAAALEGLFFGLSPAALWEGTQLGLRCTVAHPPATDAHAMGRALRVLHDWWILAQRHPADVVLDRILDEAGLLFHAAGESLGEARAGALLHLVEALRDSSLVAATGLPDAMQRLEVLLAAEAPDTPLRPGRTDAVRVMNLHKAKGLEAEVVILAAPLDLDTRAATVHVMRGESGVPTGGLCIGRRDGHAVASIAQPTGWAAMAAREELFSEAERARLLYVAVTRARRALVVSRRWKEKKGGADVDRSMWHPLTKALDARATRLEITLVPAAGRGQVQRTGAAILEDVAIAARRVQEAAVPSLSVTTVTEHAKADALDAFPTSRDGGAGRAWGVAVHRALEGLVRGRRGAALTAWLDAVIGAEALDAGEAERLRALVAGVESSEEWAAIQSKGMPMAELTVMRRTEDGAREIVTEGVIDLAVSTPDGWEVLDWKSDTVTDGAWQERRKAYDRQVAAYVTMLAGISGNPGRGTVRRV